MSRRLMGEWGESMDEGSLGGGGSGEGGLEEWLAAAEGEAGVGTADLKPVVMDYLLTEGYHEAAAAFAAEAGLDLTNAPSQKSLDQRLAIRKVPCRLLKLSARVKQARPYQAIGEGRMVEAIGAVNDLCPPLLDSSPYLHFRLLQQQLIELIREGKTSAAVEFASSALAEKAEACPRVLDELERSLALLAFPDPTQGPFASLLEPAHREQVASEVNAALLEASGAPGAPKLQRLLQMIFWAQEELDRKRAAFWKLTDATGPSFAPPTTKHKPTYALQ